MSSIKYKKKICSLCNLPKYLFSKGMCKQCAVKNYPKKEKDISEESLQILIDELDKVFSLYVRLKDADLKGDVICITCSNKFNYKDVDAGHYIPRVHMNTRWDEDNVKPQCINCNRYNYGMIDVFEKYLENNKKGITEYLKEKSKKISKISKQELKELIELYSYKNYRIQIKTK
jgi:hypothetical protein